MSQVLSQSSSHRSPVRRLAHRVTIAIIPGIVTLVVSVASYVAMQSLIESRGWVDHTQKVLSTANDVLTRVTEAESGQRAFLLTGDEKTLSSYATARNDITRFVSELQQLTVDNPRQQRRVAILDTLVRERFDAMAYTIGVRRARGLAAVDTAMDRGVDLMSQVRATATAIANEEEQLLVVRDAERAHQRFLTYAIMIIGALLAIIVSFVANRILARNILDLGAANDDLAEQAERLEEQATELETQATELEATATELEAVNVELEEQAAELETERDVAQAARAEAEQANAAKSRFLSTMSHELRTPLNAVTGYVDLMDAGVHGPVTEAQREDMRRIKRAVSQLTSVINDILNFAKLEAGEVRLHFELVYMSEALANASALMEPQAAAKNVRFVYFACEPTLTSYADRERVQQVVLNLLSNAVKYTDSGGDVRMTCERRGEMVDVSVSDTGRGVPLEDVERIFSPFVQLLSSTHSPSDGVGLGLAIGRDLARAMGGDITVRSEIGKGSTFTLSLPVARYDRATISHKPLSSGESSSSLQA